jgi:glycosyltransferase involved in cell wall biosynthesis
MAGCDGAEPAAARGQLGPAAGGPRDPASNQLSAEPAGPSRGGDLPRSHGVVLVSVGIPTFNRATTLERAVESVLMQDYPSLEVVISDNASTDGTESMCRRITDLHPNVTYVRQPSNLGPTANFLQTLSRSRGELFLWLGDDDWLADPSYISQCAGFLLLNPDHSLVCGVSRYFKGTNPVGEGIRVSLPDASPVNRVLGYYAAVGDNGTFYGVMRRQQVLSIGLSRALGGDWLLVAALAFSGKIKTLEGTAIHREFPHAQLTWDDENFRNVVRSEGLPSSHSRFPFLWISLSVLRSIAWGCPVYSSLARVSRLSLGLRCQRLVLRRHGWPRLRGRVARRARSVTPLWMWSVARSTVRWLEDWSARRRRQRHR